MGCLPAKSDLQTWCVAESIEAGNAECVIDIIGKELRCLNGYTVLQGMVEEETSETFSTTRCGLHGEVGSLYCILMRCLLSLSEAFLWRASGDTNAATPALQMPANKQLRDFLSAGFLLALLVGLTWPWLGDTISSWKVCILCPPEAVQHSELEMQASVEVTYKVLDTVQINNYRVIPTFHLCTIFLISGLTLKTQDAIDAIKVPKGLIYGLVSILGLTPLLGFAMLQIPFDNESFATGLAIFCSVPTTLSSGIALVTAVCSDIICCIHL